MSGWVATLTLLAVLTWAPASAQTPQVAVTQNAVGTLVVIRPDGIEERVQGRGALRLFERDVLRTEAGSRALIEFRDGVKVALNENTTLRLLSRWEQAKGTTRIIRLKQGEVWVRTATGFGQKAFEVETPVANAAARDTEFSVAVRPDGETVLTVVQGAVDLGTAFNGCLARASATSTVSRGKPCTEPAPTDAKAATAWTEPLLK